MLRLDSVELQKQKLIFEQVLVQELLSEVKFIQDQLAERAQQRKDFKEKVTGVILDIVSKVAAVSSAFTGVGAPLVGAFVATSGTLSEVSQIAINKFFENSKEKLNTNLGNIFYQTDLNQLEVFIRQLAKAASLRYEYFISMQLSKNPNEGVIPFARIGARRIMDYLYHIVRSIVDKVSDEDSFKQIPFTIDLLLDGLIQGHSGRWKDGFTNTPLKGKDGVVKKLTAEGAYSRAAMRIMPRKATPLLKDWPIFHRLEQDEPKRSWGWTHLSKKEASGEKIPKYGYMFVTAEDQGLYGYERTFTEQVNTNQQFNYYPTIRIATKKDIEDYERAFKLKLARNKKTLTFIDFIKRKYEIDNCSIDQVWVRGDLSKLSFSGDYSDVDFSGCVFDYATSDSAIFCRSNFSFVSAKSFICKNTNFHQADFSYSDLSDAKFDEKVTFVGAKWLGVVLKNFAIQGAVSVADLEKIQKSQDEQAKRNRAKILKLQMKIQEIKEKTIADYKAIHEKLKSVDGSLSSQAEELKKLAGQFYESQLNQQAFQSYCQARLSFFENALNSESLPPDQAVDIKKQVEALQQQDAITAGANFNHLLTDLLAKLNEAELNKERITSLTTEFSSKHEELRKQLYDEIYKIQSDITAMNERIQSTLKVSTQGRPTYDFEIMTSLDLDQDSHIKYGGVDFKFIETSPGMSEEDRLLVAPVFSEVAKGNVNMKAFKNITLKKNAYIEGTGTISITLIKFTPTYAETNSSSHFKPSPPSSDDKVLLQEAKDLFQKFQSILDDDPETREYIKTQSDYLKSIEGSRLNLKNKEELKDFIGYLRSCLPASEPVASPSFSASAAN